MELHYRQASARLTIFLMALSVHVSVREADIHWKILKSFLTDKKMWIFLLKQKRTDISICSCTCYLYYYPFLWFISFIICFSYLRFPVPSKLHICQTSLRLLWLLHSPKHLPRPLWLSLRPISISQLNALLHLHLWPINLVVFKGSYTFVGISHLEGGFTLRCLQRLSRPHIATLLCPWQNNRCTSGASIPVLSY